MKISFTRPELHLLSQLFILIALFSPRPVHWRHPRPLYRFHLFLHEKKHHRTSDHAFFVLYSYIQFSFYTSNKDSLIFSLLHSSQTFDRFDSASSIPYLTATVASLHAAAGPKLHIPLCITVDYDSIIAYRISI